MSFLLLGILTLLLVIGTPVAFALSATAIVMLLVTGDTLSVVPQVIFDTLSIYELAAVPLFVLMSQVLVAGKIGDHLFEVMNRWVGHLPGGLGIATVLSCGFFAAVAGSSTTTAATVGTSAIPAMKNHGYPKRFAYGLVAGGGTLGILIPPSIPFVLYSAIAGTSVGDLYLAGVIPGLVMMSIFIVYVVSYAKLTGNLPNAAPFSLREALSFSLTHFGALILPFIVLGSIYAGIVTPTEAAAIGAIYSILLSFLHYRSIKISDLLPMFLNTVKVTVMLLFIIAGALLLARVVTTLQIAQEIIAGLAALGSSKWIFLILINIIWIFMGDFLDVASIMLITLPIAYPVTVVLGIDPVWFAVIMVINMELATITPPVGLNLFVIMGVTDEKDFMEVLKGTVPFMVLITFVLVLVMVFPSLATWLPSQ
jgi:C4-dicarboxylate transporter, DctM subunit